MDAATYRAAAAGPQGSEPLPVAPADTPWDPELAEAMHAAGTPVYEEALHPLLGDLLAGVPPDG
jgi:hypothetical protein